MRMRVIPAIPKFSGITEVGFKKKRVCAYARVSTDTEEQLSSYAAQVDHYTKFIKANPEWEFVKVYTDEGISATNTKKREGFNQMIRDALDDKIDLVITKSVSRFARNTVDTLTTVRKLKEKGVEIYFEKENIYTLDSKGELLITIMGSIAQEESRSISENVTWGQRKRFADGKINIPYKHFLGYEKGKDGLPKIVESEAKIVRLIYKMFLEGKTPTYIAKKLTELKIPTPAKKEVWPSSTVLSILTNEKYKGDAILQKTFTVDFLTKKKKVNEGEVQQYYIEESHPAIIPPETFDLVQIELEKRKGMKKSTAGIFASKLICSECGNFYGSKVWHSNSKYRRTIWQCNHKFKNKERCRTPHFTEEELRKKFVEVFNRKLENKDVIISSIKESLTILDDTKRIDSRLEKLNASLSNAEIFLREWVKENAHQEKKQSEYEIEYRKRAEVYEKISAEIDNLEKEKALQNNRKKQVLVMLDVFKKEKYMAEFDDKVFYTLIDHVNVLVDGTLVFVFKDGTEEECQK